MLFDSVNIEGDYHIYVFDNIIRKVTCLEIDDSELANNRLRPKKRFELFQKEKNIHLFHKKGFIFFVTKLYLRLKRWKMCC